MGSGAVVSASPAAHDVEVERDADLLVVFSHDKEDPSGVD